MPLQQVSAQLPNPRQRCATEPKRRCKKKRLRQKSFYNQIFDSLDLLEDHLVASLKVMQAQHNTIKSIAGWDWIIKAISNGN